MKILFWKYAFHRGFFLLLLFIFKKLKLQILLELVYMEFPVATYQRKEAFFQGYSSFEFKFHLDVAVYVIEFHFAFTLIPFSNNIDCLSILFRGFSLKAVQCTSEVLSLLVHFLAPSSAIKCKQHIWWLLLARYAQFQKKYCRSFFFFFLHCRYNNITFLSIIVNKGITYSRVSHLLPLHFGFTRS